MKLELRIMAIFAAVMMLGTVLVGCGSAEPPPAAPAGETRKAEKDAEAEDGAGKGQSSGMSPNDLKPTDAAKDAEKRIGSAAGGGR